MPGASVRNSAHGKGHEEGGSTYAKAGSSPRSPPGNSRASTPKTHFTILCSHLWLYGELSPTTSFGEGVNLELQLIVPGCDKSVLTYKLLWRFSSLPDRLVRPHVIAHSLPTMRGIRTSAFKWFIYFLWCPFIPKQFLVLGILFKKHTRRSIAENCFQNVIAERDRSL